MFDQILCSKIFKGSKHKSDILAALYNPVNKELVKQVTSYVNLDDLNDDDAKDFIEDQTKRNSDESLKDSKESSSVSKKTSPNPSKEESSDNKEPRRHRSASPARFASAPSVDLEDSGSEKDKDEVPAPDAENSDSEVEESSKVPSKSVIASTYITVEQLSQAVTEIPGLLNLDEDTKGVTYVDVKGGSDNEFWIYYNSDININAVLDSVTKLLAASGYYYLDFHRVARDSNAIVFTINWVSTYFKPEQLQNDAKEEK